jgi:hypothetical protein
VATERPKGTTDDAPRHESAACDHSGLHSPLARYHRGRQEIRYVTVCDTCGAETAEMRCERYVPNFNARGNEPYLTVAAATS